MNCIHIFMVMITLQQLDTLIKVAIISDKYIIHCFHTFMVIMKV